MKELLLAECIGKEVDSKNTIILYKIIDANGCEYSLRPEELKERIKNNELDVLNLKLTSDNRLVEEIRTSSYDKGVEQPIEKDTSAIAEILDKNDIDKDKSDKSESDSILDRARKRGLDITEIPTFCGATCYWIKENEESGTKKRKVKVNIIYIPEDVKILNNQYVVDPSKLTDNNIEEYDGLVFTNFLMKIKGAIKVVGGKGLKDASYFFAKCRFNKVDLTKFESSNIVDMSSMFVHSTIGILNFASIDMSNVVHMNSMFRDCKITKKIENFDLNAYKSIDMRFMFKSFDYPNLNISDLRSDSLEYVTGMFEKCRAKHINIQKLNVSKVQSMARMFKGATIDVLDFTNFDTSAVETMNSMFMDSVIGNLNIFFFDTSNVKDMGNMFSGCCTNELDLLGFNTINVINMAHMFHDSKIPKLDLSSFRTPNVENMSYMFKDAEATEINAKSFRTPKVVTMKAMFYGVCASSLILKGLVEDKLISTEDMFAFFSGDYIDISNLDIAKVKNTNGMFNGCNPDLKIIACMYEDIE